MDAIVIAYHQVGRIIYDTEICDDITSALERPHSLMNGLSFVCCANLMICENYL